MIIRIAIAALVLLAVYLVWRNLGGRARFEAQQRKAWDEPLREGSAVILAAAASAWWWLLGLALLAAVIGRMLMERIWAGDGFMETGWHWLLFAALAAVVGRRAVQLSEKITVTWERMTSRTVLGERWSAGLDEVTGVSQDDRTARIALTGGRVVELPAFLEGRFWLARELQARLERDG